MTDMVLTNNTSFMKIAWFISIFLFLSIFENTIFAQGDLLIYPKRVALDGKKKIEKLILSNMGKDSAVYNISFVEYKMNEKGELKIILDPEEGLNFASPYVRVFPRKVSLAPGESQTVKVQLTNTQKLLEGEYRSHLYFRAEDDKVPLGEVSKKKGSTISVRLKPVFGISIPCIFRIGESTTIASLSDIILVKDINNEDELQFKLNRVGNMSLYGDFTINFIDKDDKTFEVAKAKGVGVYTPNPFRTMNIKLNKPENINFIGGFFKVIFFQNESNKVQAESTLKM